MEKNVTLEEFMKMQKILPSRKCMKKVMTVTNKGELHICRPLLRQLIGDEGKLYLDLRYSDDYRIIAFRKVENDGCRVPKSGNIKIHDFYRKIREKGYKIPAEYIFEENEKDGVWCGYMQEVEPLDMNLLSSTKKRRKKYNEEKKL